jgi:hypothetical protein
MLLVRSVAAQDEGYVIARITAASAAAAVIVVSGGDGSRRGTLYGAYGLLRHLGFRFFAPTEMVVPDASTIAAALAAGIHNETRKPGMIWRSIESFETNGADPLQTPPTGTTEQQAANYRWLVRAHDNSIATEHSGGSFPTWAGPSAHTSCKFWPPPCDVCLAIPAQPSLAPAKFSEPVLLCEPDMALILRQTRCWARRARREPRRHRCTRPTPNGSGLGIAHTPTGSSAGRTNLWCERTKLSGVLADPLSAPPC